MEIELFPCKYLIRNPTRHHLYRPHRALSDTEKQILLKKTHSLPEQLPKLFRDDRICQYFNYPIGTVIEIIRCYGSLGPYKYYRIVDTSI